LSERGAADGRSRWLVSARWDLAVFGGSAALALALLAWGRYTGLLTTALPAWAWLATVVFVDVAHVWATAYRVYLDPEERRRRPELYAGIPIAAYVTGVLLYSLSAGLFWRVLAYLAVLHFVRQQYGWVALYRRKLGVGTRFDRVLDDAAIYSATLYPLLYWHGHLPREFEWFIAGDFFPGLPAATAEWLAPLHWGITLLYVGRQLQLRASGRPTSSGKDLIVATTWLCWSVGIVVFDSDYAFTITNVLIHGIPYIGLIWVYGHARWRDAPRAAPVARLFRPAWVPLFLAPLFLAAWSEEWLWDRLVWHERAGLFPGPDWAPGSEALALIVPLLALPQATHYLLDAWIWKVNRDNPGPRQYLGF
jgi:hypothetical protein